MARLDHLLVSVADLDASAAAWMTAGIPVSKGGEHPGGTRNVLIRGDEPAYLELINARPDAPGDVASQVRNRPGPLSWAITVEDIETARAAVREAGHAAGPVNEGSRVNADGTRLAWRTCDLGRIPLDPHLPFLIDWETPMSPAPTGMRLRSVRIEVPAPDAVAQILSAVGLRPEAEARGEVRALTDGTVDLQLIPGLAGLVGVTAELDGRQESLQLDGLRIDLVEGS